MKSLSYWWKMLHGKSIIRTSTLMTLIDYECLISFSRLMVDWNDSKCLNFGIWRYQTWSFSNDIVCQQFHLFIWQWHCQITDLRVTSSLLVLSVAVPPNGSIWGSCIAAAITTKGVLLLAGYHRSRRAAEHSSVWRPRKMGTCLRKKGKLVMVIEVQAIILLGRSVSMFTYKWT